MQFEKIEKAQLKYINKLNFDLNTFKSYLNSKPTSHDPTVQNSTTLNEDFKKLFESEFLKTISTDNPTKNLILLEKWIVKTLSHMLKSIIMGKREYKEVEKEVIDKVINSQIIKPLCSMHDIVEQFKKPLIEKPFNSNYEFKHQINDTIKFNKDKITYEEFNKTIISMNGSKTYDFIGLSFNMIKYIECIHLYIIEQFNKLIEKPELSGDNNWTDAILFVKYKGSGDLSNPINFRPVVSLNIMTRLFNRIIGFRLYNYLFDNVIIDGTIQRGLISNHNGVLENTLIVKDTFLHALKNENSMVCTFLDIKKAYNSIKIETIIYACKKYNVPNFIRDYIKHYYENINARIYMDKETSESFKWNNGILQGCSLANILFLMCFNLVIAEIKEHFKDVLTEYSYNDKLFMLAFVDDLVIFTKTKKQMNNVLEVANNIINNCGMELNNDKSNYYDINTLDELDLDIVNNIKRLEDDKPFRYLGCWMVPNGDKKNSFDKYKNQLREKLEEIDKIEPPKFFKTESQITSFRLNLFSRVYQKTTWDLQRLDWKGTDFIKDIIQIEKEFLRKWINTPNNPNKFNEIIWDKKTTRRCIMVSNIKDKSILFCDSEIMFDYISMNNDNSSAEDTKKYIETRKAELEIVKEDTNNDYYGDISL